MKASSCIAVTDKLDDEKDSAVWMRRAEAALRAAALAGAPGTCWEDFCFHCQQAAEKAIKAIYISIDVPHRFTHSIESLLTALLRLGYEIPEDVRKASFLSRFAGETRYPGVYERIEEVDYRRAFEAAQCVVDWAKSIVKV